jgi:hypothetical protein
MYFAAYPATIGEPPPAACDGRNLPTRTTGREFKSPVACTPSNSGVPKPIDVVSAAAIRALVMLDNTIDQLVSARTKVCAGTAPATALSAVAFDWLRNRLSVCVDDLRVWRAGTFVNGSVAEVIRRLVRIRNLIASPYLRYSCGSPDCDPDDWAFVRARDAAGNCLPGTPMMLIRLCSNFWHAGKFNDGKPVPPDVFAEFQAQTIIHEASHLTHCTRDFVGRTMGIAECVAQFVAATNNSPLDPRFSRRCATTTACGPVAALRRTRPTSRLGEPGSVRTAVSFRPDMAIHFKGPPGARR